MFFLKTNSRQKSIFLFISIVSLIFLSVQLIRYEYDSFSITNIFGWSKDEITSFDEIKTPVAKHEPTPHEKYLTYLPYSRFSNQRSTLLNAALLAKYLNRTLVVPPMFLGNANGWSPAPGLYRVLANMTDAKFQEKCFDDEGNEIPEVPILQEGQEEVPFGCYNFTSYVMVPWSWATDLNKLTRSEEEGGLGLKIIERSDMSLLALQKQLGINDDEMFLMQDSTRYQWHIYDSDNESPNLRYQFEISLKELMDIQERLLHFYGIFGYDRLMLNSPESEEYRLRIEQALIFRHPAISEASAIILEQLLDGVQKEESELVPLDPIQAKVKEAERHELPRFVAAHIRAGDGVFLRNLKDRIPEFVHQIWDIMTGNEKTVDDLVGKSNKVGAQDSTPKPRKGPLPKAPKELRNALKKLDIHERLSECARRKEMVLYVATDAASPRTSDDFKPVLDAFPCTFFMSDFDTKWREPLQKVRSPLDQHKDLTEHLVMFVDATVCSWAERFVGTRTSTFSNYIKQYRHAIVDELIDRKAIDS